MINAFTVDLEDWFNVYNLKEIIPRDEWNNQEIRVRQNVNKILELLDKFEIKATFFVLGWIAERVPDLIKEVKLRGHEIASHGYSHKLLTEITPEEFRFEMKKSISILEDCTGDKILGYRAPSFTITNKTLWALDILSELGFRYDSSIFPMGFHPEYGINGSKLEIYRITDNLIELPMSCAELFGKRIPCCGGGYFRLLPYPVTKYLMNKCNDQGRPVVFYIHPWEIDTDQPKQKLPLVNKFRHYNNLHKTYKRLEILCTDFKFSTITEVLNVSKY